MKNISKNILITGSEGQIGKNLIDILDKNNFRIISIDKIKTKKKDYFRCDISNSKNLSKVIKKIGKKYKQIDVLINLAASQKFTDFDNRIEKEIEEMLNVNIKANILLSQFVYNKYFKKQKRGKIINIGSIFGIKSPDFMNYNKGDRKSSETYGATKASIIQLTKYFANYMSKYNVNVNCISPGGVENKKKQTKLFIKKYSSKVPAKRMANENEISNLILFLISNKSNYINGQNIIIDGGYTA